jgi:hypothetical protein
VVAVLLVRGLLSPFAHPLFTAMTGIGAGIAARHRSRTVGVVAVLVGYLAAVCLHALWNSSATLFGGNAFLGIYGFVMVPLFVAMIAVVIWQRRREQRIVIDQLPAFARAGWIAPSEITLLSTLAGRRGWRAAVRRRSGRQVAKAVSQYQAAVTELAFLRDRMARGSIGPSGPYWHDQALAALFRARLNAVGHPEALTVALRHHGPPVGPHGWIPPPPGPPPGVGGRDAEPVDRGQRQGLAGRPPAQPPQSWPGPGGSPNRR